MTLFKKARSKRPQIVPARPLSVTEVAVVSGGINPQPLPPRRHIAV